MNSQNSSDILKKLINESKILKNNQSPITEDEIKKRISGIDRKAAINKLRSLGLGSIADKVNSLSDEQLVDMIGKNPGLLKKINDFIK
ncbi:MAG: hypothetical protein II998_10990 [Clostridia bacterium]|nr:hypothetical protein [Clostridia bacterium]